MKWVIQNNLNTSCVRQLIKACQEVGVNFETINVIPFDDTLPNISTKQNTLFYGGTNFVTNIWKSGLWKPGVFFSAENFTFSAYKEHWRVLNSDAKILALKDIHKENINPDDFIFLRPNKDLKEFAGEVIRFKELTSWVDKISFGNYLLDSSCEVVISEPYAIKDEWRIFIVGGEPITGSHYRSYGRLDIQEAAPKEVLEFAKQQISKWVPAPIFALDVGRCGDGLYVIEANCFNSSGFYKADINLLVNCVTKYCSEIYNKLLE